MDSVSHRQRLQSLLAAKIVASPAIEPKRVQPTTTSARVVQEPDREESPESPRNNNLADCDYTSFGVFEPRGTASWPSAATGSNELAANPAVAVASTRSPVTSFGSVAYGRGASCSFDSTVTDFDYITSPGAQAELNAEYVDAIRSAQPCTIADPDMTPLRSAVLPASMVMTPSVFDSTGFAARPCLPHGSGASELQAQAAEFEFMAAQIMAQAYQAKANALRMQETGQETPALPSSNVLLAQSGSLWPASYSASQVPGESRPSPEQGRSKPKQGPTTTSAKNKDSERTTVMLRNLPNDYTRNMLIRLLDTNGFRGSYNFIYLPMDLKRKAGLGYAFVNMVTPSEAQRSFTVLQGFSEWKMLCSSKVLEMAWGDPLQGLDAHVNRYRNSPVMHEDAPIEFRPLLFKDGQQVEFPPPTRKLRAPRLDFRAH